MSTSDNYDHLKPSSQPHSVPSIAGNLVTLVDRCWVCQRGFPGYGDPKFSTLGLVQEFHHIVPRAYGGSDGPTVSICSGHHTTAHDIAKKLSAGKPFFNFLTKNEEIDRRLLYLATRIQNAEALFKADPNKRLTFVSSISKEEARMMNELYPVYKVKSREALFHLLLAEAYSRVFPRKRSK